MLQVVSFEICPFVQRVTAALEARGVPFELRYIDLAHKPQWFLDISPNGQVPVLVTESGVALFESEAIIEFIDDAHGPLEPHLPPEQRAVDRAWSYQASKHYLVQCGAMRSKDEAQFNQRAQKLNQALAKVERQLGAGPFFKGFGISNVDIAWLPLLHRAAIVEQRTGYDLLDQYPKVKSWQHALLETGLPTRSVSKDFEERFARFYLSEETYLGQHHRKADARAQAG